MASCSAVDRDDTCGFAMTECFAGPPGANPKRNGATANEVATALRLTGNAIRNQLRALVKSRFAETSEFRQGVSKPSALYSITLLGQAQFSTLYLPVLCEFLRSANGRCSGAQLGTFMKAT